MTSSKMFEGYCADIEGMLREGSPRPALRLAVALPDICTALSDATMKSSAKRYAAWCKDWLQAQTQNSSNRIDGDRLYLLHTRRKRVGGRPGRSHTEHALGALRKRRAVRATRSLNRSRIAPAAGTLQALEISLCEVLVAAARRWYLQVGSRDTVVQRNLGILAITR